MIHIVYKVICLITDRYYIGKHSTRDIDDGYLGSGKLIRASVAKHGRDSHVRSILFTAESRESAAGAERTLVELCLADPKCMNLAPGGNGGTIFRSAETRAKQSASRRGKKYPKHSASLKGKSTWMKGRKHRSESIEKLKKNHIGMTGKRHSPDTIEKMRSTKRRKSDG